MRQHSIGEMRHAESVMERVLFLDGIPNVQRLGKINVGETVLEQFKSDLQLELEALTFLEQGIKICQEQGDFGSKNLLEAILAAEEAHVDWLEEQLEIIKQVGEANYLAQQIA